MFTKQPTKTPSTMPAKIETVSPAPELNGRRGPKIASLISEDLTVEGGIVGDGELHVDGVIRGDVRVGRLSIGETGNVEGSITAEAVECRGRIVGSITAKQVRLYGTAHVDGDITHEQLAMETGAFFQGRSLKFQRAAQPTPAIQGDVINVAAAL
ncbi:polymer-forming cytoskeletal protein [soil metagenome]